MMELFDVLILGITQGLTEFLPVSSSGHLVIIEQLLGNRQITETGITLEIALHVGTLLAILLFFRKDFLRMMGWVFRVKSREGASGETGAVMLWVVIGCIPTVLLGFILMDRLESFFESPVLVGVALCFTGALCLITRLIPEGNVTMERLGVMRSLCVGFTQGLAIIPGISRSGATIVMAMCLGVRPADAGRYSFLLFIPVVAGAAVYKMPDGGRPGGISTAVLVLGVLSSALVGFLCLSILIRLLKGGNFYVFGFYCIPLGLFAIYFLV